MRTLGIIPARGGSKGIPNKNIRLFGGIPLIAHSIHTAQHSRRLDHFIVSTDDRAIADVARGLDAEVLRRPTEFARDDSPMNGVVMHALDALGEDFDTIVLLQPTSPLRTSDDIDSGIDLFARSGGDAVVSISSVGSFHPSRMYRLVDGELEPVAEEPEARLRQDLSPVFIRNGALYICDAKQFRETGELIGTRVIGYVMPPERSANIDEEVDLVVAEWLLQANAGQQ